MGFQQVTCSDRKVDGGICRIHTQQAVDKEVATNLCSCSECFNKVTCHVQQLSRVHVGLLAVVLLFDRVGILASHTCSC